MKQRGMAETREPDQLLNTLRPRVIKPSSDKAGAPNDNYNRGKKNKLLTASHRLCRKKTTPAKPTATEMLGQNTG